MEDNKELVIFSVIGIIFAMFFGWSFLSQPTGNIPINYSQSQSNEIASDFLTEEGYANISEYNKTSTFTTKSMISTYIQLNYSREEARKKIKKYNIRYWEVRFYKPKEKEEFKVGIDPIDGEIVKFEHIVAEEASGENLPRRQAFEKAKTFLTEQGFDLSKYKLVENTVNERLNRTDHEFSWRETDKKDNAPFEIDVKIQGDRIGFFSSKINIPDKFTHTYKTERSPGSGLNIVFFAASAIIIVAGIYLGLQYFKADEFDKRYALTFAIIAGVLLFIMMINSLPGILYRVPTFTSPSMMTLSMVIGAFIAALVVAGITIVSAGTGKELSSEVLDFDVIDGIFSKENRKRLKYSTFRGFWLAFILLGIATLFYLVGSEYFGVWMPENSPYLSAVPTYVPALMALTAGGIAAITEETIFRLFSIPLLKRYLKYTVIAVVISSFIWGIGHTGYVVLPWYTRIIEVTLLGIVLGGAFLRYDLVTTLSAHFSMNAFIVAIPMVLAGTSWLKLNGFISIIIATLPLLISITLLLYEKFGNPPERTLK